MLKIRAFWELKLRRRSRKFTAKIVRHPADCKAECRDNDFCRSHWEKGEFDTKPLRKYVSKSYVFIELGATGAVDFASRLGILLDETMKYIAVNRKQETNLPGVYAAGDICGPPWQVAKSVGEGCVAGIEAASFAGRRKRSGQDK